MKTELDVVKIVRVMLREGITADEIADAAFMLEAGLDPSQKPDFIKPSRVPLTPTERKLLRWAAGLDENGERPAGYTPISVEEFKRSMGETKGENDED